MKKLLAVTFLSTAFSANQSFAQWVPVSPGSPNIITNPASAPPIDKVGIGVSAGSVIQDKLTVNGDIGFDPARGAGTYGSLRGRLNNGGVVLWGNNDWNDGGGIMINGNGTASSRGSLHFVATSALATPGNPDETSFGFWNTWSSNVLNIYKNGNISMGGMAINHADKLTVGGDISLYKSSGTDFRAIRGRAPYAGLVLWSNSSWNDGCGLMMNSNGTSSDKGSMQFVSSWSVGASTRQDRAFAFWGTDESGSGAWAKDFLDINKDGNVGIGNDPSTTSGEKLKVGGDVWLYQPYDRDFYHRHIRARSNTGALVLEAGNDAWDGSSIQMNGRWATPQGQIDLKAYTNDDLVNDNIINNAHHRAFTFQTMNETSHDERFHMTILADGRVVIGDIINYTENYPRANTYKLIVQTGILTEKIRVASSSDYLNWSDFVFDDDYELMPLRKLEKYIGANNHLPDVPTSAEVSKDGIDLAAMDAKLLQKIEELTLYVIQQQNQIDELKKQLKH